MTHPLTRVVLTAPSLTVGLLPRSMRTGRPRSQQDPPASIGGTYLNLTATCHRAKPLLTRGLLTLLTLAIPTIPTEITAARVLQLATAFGADAD